ncbi:ChbG/HpnK family deacetylase, partial [Escherichia coli]|uniref:ChbG/HpnK family deacetylase n=1 Tax=Escherichia coli TaxID=562 RepID=UPI002899F39E
ALINGEAVEHAAQLSRELPELGVGMHVVLTLGLPLSPMPGLTRDGQLGKWIWEMAEQDALPLDEIARELDCQFNRFVDVFGREPTHID